MDGVCSYRNGMDHTNLAGKCQHTASGQTHYRIFSLSQMSVSKYILIYLLMTACFCIFAGMIIFALKSTASFWQFASRAHFPIAFLGCYQFPWEMAYKAVWPLAIIDLVNPFMYAVEGMRAAVLGQAGFLNYWLCVSMLVLLRRPVLYQSAFAAL